MKLDGKYQKLGLIIDSMDNLARAIKLPLHDHEHVNKMRKLLPEKVQELKESFVEITGIDPWEFD